MEDDEHSGKIVEVHINLNGQPFVGDIDNNEHELQSSDLKEQENEEVHQSSLNSEINLDTLPSMHVHFLREPPSVIDNEDLNSASNVDGQSGVCVVSDPVCGSAVLLSETISMSSANLSGLPVVLTTPVLSSLCAATPDNIEGLHVDDDHHGSLLNISKSETEETQDMDDSCIGLTASDSGITTVTDKVTQTVPVESIVVTTHQTSMCYLRQIFDHDQVTSQGQMPTLAHGVTSHNLPELKQCKWQGCCKHFLSLEDLVQHVNEFHIRTDKHSEFCCHWKGCNRNGKGFNARYKMLIHMRTHTGEKPHKCHHEDCGKSFSRLENLKIHQRSHTGERPYTCPIEGCDKRYSNSSDRFKHTRTHYERKPYHCRIEGCEKCYTDPSSLRKHLKTHHGQDVNIEEQE